MYSLLQKLSQIEKETGICKCRLEVMATFVAIQAVVKNGFHCTVLYCCSCNYCTMFTTATIQRTRSRSRTITKVAVGTTFSIFLNKINYLLGAIHVSLKYLSLLLFFTVSHFLAILCGIFCTWYANFIRLIHLA